MVLAFTGLRWEEAVAVPIGNVGLDGQCMKIDRTASESGGRRDMREDLETRAAPAASLSPRSSVNRTGSRCHRDRRARPHAGPIRCPAGTAHRLRPQARSGPARCRAAHVLDERACRASRHAGRPGGAGVYSSLTARLTPRERTRAPTRPRGHRRGLQRKAAQRPAVTARSSAMEAFMMTGRPWSSSLFAQRSMATRSTDMPASAAKVACSSPTPRWRRAAATVAA